MVNETASAKLPMRTFIRGLGGHLTTVADDILWHTHTRRYDAIHEPSVYVWIAEFIGRVLGPRDAAPFVLAASDDRKVVALQLGLGLRCVGVVLSMSEDPAAYGFLLDVRLLAVFFAVKYRSSDFAWCKTNAAIMCQAIEQTHTVFSVVSPSITHRVATTELYRNAAIIRGVLRACLAGDSSGGGKFRDAASAVTVIPRSSV